MTVMKAMALPVTVGGWRLSHDLNSLVSIPSFDELSMA